MFSASRGVDPKLSGTTPVGTAGQTCQVLSISCLDFTCTSYASETLHVRTTRPRAVRKSAEVEQMVRFISSSYLYMVVTGLCLLLLGACAVKTSSTRQGISLVLNEYNNQTFTICVCFVMTFVLVHFGHCQQIPHVTCLQLSLTLSC